MSGYSRVHRLQSIRVEGSTLEGFACPRSSPLCCALELVADDHVVAAFRADRFSSFAARNGLRDGWCAFSYRLRPADFIFSDKLKLRCLVSRVEVFEIDHAAVRWEQKSGEMQGGRTISLKSLLDAPWPAEICDATAYCALIERTTERFDDHRFIEFQYRLLLNRELDSEAVSTFAPIASSRDGRRRTFEMIVASPEYASKRKSGFPSPFDENFPAVPVFSPVD